MHKNILSLKKSKNKKEKLKINIITLNEIIGVKYLRYILIGVALIGVFLLKESLREYNDITYARNEIKKVQKEYKQKEIIYNRVISAIKQFEVVKDQYSTVTIDLPKAYEQLNNFFSDYYNLLNIKINNQLTVTSEKSQINTKTGELKDFYKHYLLFDRYDTNIKSIDIKSNLSVKQSVSELRKRGMKTLGSNDGIMQDYIINSIILDTMLTKFPLDIKQLKFLSEENTLTLDFVLYGL